jgi:hypothetical protein
VVGGITGLAPAVSEPFSVDPRSATSVLLELAPGRTLTGRVVDRSGKPVAGAVVTVGYHQSNQVATGADGSFKIADAPLGEVVVNASAFSAADLLFGEVTAAAGLGALPDIVVSAMASRE